MHNFFYFVFVFNLIEIEHLNISVSHFTMEFFLVFIKTV